MFDDLMAMFQPGRRHLTDERNRIELDRKDPESGAPPRGVDVETGRIRIRLATRSTPERLWP